MIVCVCHAVSDRAVREALANGASSAEDVARLTAAGTACGGCRTAIADLVTVPREECESATPCPGCPRRH